jgi:hypothetical protein
MKSETIKVDVPVTTYTVDWHTVVTFTSAERIQVAALLRMLDVNELSDAHQQLANEVLDKLGVTPLERPKSTRICAYGRCTKRALTNFSRCREHGDALTKNY